MVGIAGGCVACDSFGAETLPAASVSQAPVAKPSGPDPEPEPRLALEEPADPDQACVRLLLTAYRGAALASDTVARSKPEARARAEQLLATLERSPREFAQLAREHSDAPSSSLRGGFVGTFRRDAWPALHETLRRPVFALKVHEVGGLLEAPYGFAIVQRCRVDKAHGRHVLIRYKGAKRADRRVRRSKAGAREIAEQLHTKLSEGADFERVARKHSEDASAERGGDIGPQGRGRLALPFEEALFALEPGELSPVVESEYGFHIIQRLPLP